MVTHDTRTVRIARDGLQRGLTYDQIADLIGTTKGVVAGIIHRRIRGLGPDQAGSRLRKLTVAQETILASLLAGGTVAEAARLARLTQKTVRKVRDQLVDEGRLIPEQVPASVPPEPAPPAPAPAPAPALAQTPPSVTVTSEKPSAIVKLRSIRTVFTPRPHAPKARPTWDASTQRRLAAAVAASSSLQEVADRMGMTVLGVGTRMSRTGLKLTTVLTWTERDAVDRLHGEGVTPRRIAVRVGVPRHLVDERIAQIEDGTAIRIWIDGLDSGTRKGADVGKDGGSSPQDVGKAE